MKKGKIIVAMDVSSTSEAMKLIDHLGASPWAYKIGLQLFVREGPAVVAAVKATGARIFLDLKFHDIPNTVKEAVRSAISLGADMLTVHLSGGLHMLQAAVEGAQGSSCLLLGVSVLTSSDATTLQETGVSGGVESQVARLAGLGIAAGLGGIVASPLEISLIRKLYGEQLQIITPGVRPLTAKVNDQKRVMTPGDATIAGADALVIGRPITAAPSPLEAFRAIEQEINVARASRSQSL